MANAESRPESDPDFQPLASLCEQVAGGRSAARQLATLAKRHGMTEAETRFLHCLHYGGQHDQSQLARELQLSPAQISSMVERLRAKGVVLSTISRTDRRKQFWELAPLGTELLDKLYVDCRLLHASSAPSVQGVAA